MQVMIASYNPVKIKATLKGFKRIFKRHKIRIDSGSDKSGVSVQPMTDKETFQGALNRAKRIKKLNQGFDYYVGIEGGIEQFGNQMATFAWVVVISQAGKIGKARTGIYFLPEKVCKLIKKGKELGEADDIVFGKSNSKQKNGAVGILTHDAIDRAELISEAVSLAIIPFINPELY
jgi:inosine/xanthosine triphosphatase